jgi:hypothetical protein
MDGMVLASAFRNCGIQDAQFGEVFLAQDGEKFIIGRAGDGKSVAVMIDGDFGNHKPFYFAPLDTWNRRGVAVGARLTLVPTSQANPTAIPPGAVSVDGEMIHILAFSGQSYQPVAIVGDGGSPSSAAAAFAKWAFVVEGSNGNPVELFAFGSE